MVDKKYSLLVSFLLGVMLAALIFNIAPSSAQARAELVIQGKATRPYQKWLNQMKLPSPSGKVFVSETYRPCGYYAEACLWGGDQLEIRPRQYRYIFFHEMGHFFDHFIINSVRQKILMRLYRAPNGHWDDWSEPFAQIYEFGASGLNPYNRRLLREYNWDMADDLFTPTPGMIVETLNRIRFWHKAYEQSLKSKRLENILPKTTFSYVSPGLTLKQ